MSLCTWQCVQSCSQPALFRTVFPSREMSFFQLAGSHRSFLERSFLRRIGLSSSLEFGKDGYSSKLGFVPGDNRRSSRLFSDSMKHLENVSPRKYELTLFLARAFERDTPNNMKYEFISNLNFENAYFRCIQYPLSKNLLTPKSGNNTT